MTLIDATAGLSVDGRPGLRDVALTAESGYLYAIDADAGTIFGWAVGDGGSTFRHRLLGRATPHDRRPGRHLTCVEPTR